MDTIYIIEGIDHIGKTSLIESLRKTEEGITIHCGKPLFVSLAYDKLSRNREMSNNQFAFFKKHCDLFDIIFEDVNNEYSNIYLDRFHLGEYVYWKYRPTNQNSKFGEYDNIASCWNRSDVFNKIDSKLADKGSFIKLRLLTYRNEDFLQKHRHSDKDNPYDDSLESIITDNNDFLQAFEFSRINNKKIIYVDDVNGKWRSYDEILKEAL